MGIRQTALPLGVGLAALAEPVLAETRGLSVALLAPSLVGVVACAAVALFVVDPPRDVSMADTGTGIDGLHSRRANPYRADRQLVRIHVASALLVIPQITVWTFIVVWLIDARGWSTAAAGGLAAATQLLGAAGRIGAGWWSDRVGSRVGPIRIIALSAAVAMLLLGLTEPTSAAVVVMIVATVVTVADNGLAFTAVAELGGPYWAGRAMGNQNTGQYLMAAAVPATIGALIAERGYATAFAAVAVFPMLALAVLPTGWRRTSGQDPGKP
jgi:sugar phosphate permease